MNFLKSLRGEFLFIRFPDERRMIVIPCAYEIIMLDGASRPAFRRPILTAQPIRRRFDFSILLSVIISLVINSGDSPLSVNYARRELAM